MGIFERLLKVLYAPGIVFEDTVKSPKLLIPILLITILATGYSTYWVFHIDAEAVVSQSLERSGKVDKIPADKKETIITMQSKFLIYIIPISAFVVTPLFCLAIGLYFFVVSKISATERTYSQCTAIPAYAQAITIPSVIVGFFIMLASDFSTTPLENIIPSNPGYFFNPEDIGRKLHAFVKSLDFFTIWYLVLLIVGFSVVTGKKMITSSLLVLVPWILIIVVSVVFA